VVGDLVSGNSVAPRPKFAVGGGERAHAFGDPKRALLGGHQVRRSASRPRTFQGPKPRHPPLSLRGHGGLKLHLLHRCCALGAGGGRFHEECAAVGVADPIGDGGDIDPAFHADGIEVVAQVVVGPEKGVTSKGPVAQTPIDRKEGVGPGTSARWIDGFRASISCQPTFSRFGQRALTS